MNKKDLNEIKKQFKNKDSLITINKVVTAAINDHNVMCQTAKEFYTYSEDECNEITRLLSKSLSGKFGSAETEYAFDSKGTTTDGEYIQKLLFNSKELNTEEQQKIFVNHLKENIKYEGPYAIIAANCTYSYTNKDDDSFDYNFLLTSICPISAKVEGLIFNNKENLIEKKQDYDRIIGDPTDGFLYPTFSDNSADANHVLYYTKKPKEPNTSIIEETLGCKYIMNADTQNTTFWAIAAKALKDDLTVETISNINNQLNDMVNASSGSSEPREIDSNDIEDIMENANCDKQQTQLAKDLFEEKMGKQTLTASNLCENKVTIKNNDVTITINCSDYNKIKPQILHGRKCIIIDVDDPNVFVNGIQTVIKSTTHD